MKFGAIIEVDEKRKKIKKLGEINIVKIETEMSFLKVRNFEEFYLYEKVTAGSIETKVGRKIFLERIDELMEILKFNGLFLEAPTLFWYKDLEEIENIILKRFLEIYNKLKKKYEIFVINTSKISSRWYTKGLGCSPFDSPKGLKELENIVIDTYLASYNKEWNYIKLYLELKEKIIGYIVRDYIREDKESKEMELGKGELNMRILKNLNPEMIIFKEKEFEKGVKLWKSLSKH